MLESSCHNIFDWRKTFLPPTATIKQAIESLAKTTLQIVLVVSPSDILMGTVTDGDIRRSLLRGFSLDSPIDSIMECNPLVAPEYIGKETLLDLMRINKILQLPIVNSEHKVVGLHLWDEIISPTVRDNPMIIMAGGEGKRLRPLTQDCPKPMLPISGRPMLEHIINNAVHEGFKYFIISINYLGHIIKNHFGDGENWGVKIDYVHEEIPLGTAGSLSLLKNKINKPFVVTNGDVLTDVKYGDLLDFHVRQQAAATMAVRQHEIAHPFGVVSIDGIDIKGFEEKPIWQTHVNAGIYALDPMIITALSENVYCDMPDLFLKLNANGNKTIAYPMHEPWLDIGRPSDLELARLRSSSIRLK